MAEAMRKKAAKTDDPADLAQLLTYEAAEARRRQDEGLALAPGAFSSDSERIVFAELSAVALTAGTNISQAKLQVERIARGASLQAATSASAPAAVIVSQTMAAIADSRNAAATAAAAAAGLVPVLEVGPRLDNSAVIGRAVELGRSALAGVAGDSAGNDAIRLAAAQVESDIRASLGLEIRRLELSRASIEMIFVSLYDSAHHRDANAGAEYRVLMKAEIAKAEQDHLYPVPNAYELPRRTSAAETARAKKAVDKSNKRFYGQSSFYGQQQDSCGEPFYNQQSGAFFTPNRRPQPQQQSPSKKKKKTSRGGGGGGGGGGNKPGG
jgi:hypothetical protein